MFRILCCLLVGASLPAAGAAGADDGPVAGLRVPQGFEVTRFAGDDLAHDIYTLTIDAAGRVVVAGRGYVKILHDDDGDGRAERATVFSETPKQGARGMYFDGPDLICTGDGALARYEDRDGDLVADGPPKVLARLKQAGDHSSNGVVKGPDGWYYIACGNEAAIGPEHASTPGSPVQKPHQGVMVRVAPEGEASEVIADGFRNPYDLAFDARGSLMTVDADGERDQYLPWYSPTRLFDVAAGMHHGWMLPGWVRSWNRPPWFFDNVDRLVEIGRGSPTGMTVYRHRQFPTKYRGGVFSCCWSLGRVYYLPLSPDGATYASRREIFLQATGGAGFAPVDVAIGPEGDLFVAIGGRGTQGGVFRIVHESHHEAEQTERQTLPMERVLAANQPLASWSRTRWDPLANKLGPAALAQAAAEEGRPAEQRIRAVEILVELFDGVDIPLARRIATEKERSPAVAARVAWSLARRPQGKKGETLLAELTHGGDPWVDRAAWEALATLPELTSAALQADWSDMRDRRHRRVRAAAILAAARLDAVEFSQMASRQNDLDGRLAVLWTRHYRGDLSDADFARTLEVFQETADVEMRLEAARLLQILLGDIRGEPTEPDVYAGYVVNEPGWKFSHRVQEEVSDALAAAFPSGDERLDREIARLAGMLQVESLGLAAALAEKWTGDSRVEEDIHYLIVLSRLPGPRSEAVTRNTSAALAHLHRKMIGEDKVPSRFWPERVGETFTELAGRDLKLASALIEHPAFALPEQSVFALRMSRQEQKEAARRLMESADDAWSPELVKLAAVLPPEEHQPPVREAWDYEFTLREPAIAALARHPRKKDRRRFVETLRSGSPEIATLAAEALIELGGDGKAEEIATALTVMRAYLQDEQYAQTAMAFHRLLRTWAGEEPVEEELLTTDPTVAYRQWTGWFAMAYPHRAAELTRTREAGAAELLDRLEAIDWSQGDAGRGKGVFERLQCARCHQGSSRWGPDLKGAASRFSRRDLFAAIVDPSRDVSPAYRMTQVTTDAGRVVVGQVIYESPEATLVQTGPETTERIAGEQIIAVRQSPLSPMPSDLLRDATDQDLADLYAYLKALDQ